MSGDETKNGYTADDSSGNNDDTDSSFAGAPREICPGFIVDVEERDPKHAACPRRRQSRKRPLVLPKSLPKAAPSPIHPDIDINLTRHVMGTDVLKAGSLAGDGTTSTWMEVGMGGSGAASTTLASTATLSQSRQADALSRLLVDYFGAVRKAGQQASEKKNKNGDGSRTTESKSTLESNAPSHSSRSGGPSTNPSTNIPVHTSNSHAEIKPLGKKRPSTRKKIDSSKPSQAPTPPLPSQPKKFDPIVPQIIADIPLPEIKPTTTFSSQQRRLEEALELTQIPRLLIEAVSPHRVVHMNAAFSKYVIQNTSNIQRWIEKQNSSTIPKDRSLQQAIEDMIPGNTTVPLSGYPVQGSSATVSHYLIEPSSDSSRKRRRFEELPSRAIG